MGQLPPRAELSTNEMMKSEIFKEKYVLVFERAFYFMLSRKGHTEIVDDFFDLLSTVSTGEGNPLVGSGAEFHVFQRVANLPSSYPRFAPEPYNLRH